MPQRTGRDLDDRRGHFEGQARKYKESPSAATDAQLGDNFGNEMGRDCRACLKEPAGIWMTVASILKGKLGSIKRAPLPPQTPSWETILAMKWEEIVEHASKNRPGF